MVVVSGIVSKYGVDGLHVCTLMAGFFIALLGITRLGSAVKYVPRPIVTGFTNGIAVLIASTQIKDFFGLQVAHLPGEFAGRVVSLAVNFKSLSLPTTALAAAALAIVLLTPKVNKRIPGSIMAMFAATAAVLLFHLPVATIGTRYGGIPGGLPRFEPPHIRLDLLSTLLAPALTIAMLGAIESLMSAMVADKMTGDRHDPNVELVGQGVANIVSPLFGGLPATGAIARTATNIRSGAQTPVAGIIHSLTLLAIVLFAAPLARFIPLAALAAILMVVAWNMGEWMEIPKILKLPVADKSVWAITFALTVFTDLTVAVEIGMILSVLLYVHKVTATTTVTEVTPENINDSRGHNLQDKLIPDYVAMFRIHGPFLFGASDKIAHISDQINALPPIVILRLRNMTAIDPTGLHAIENLAERLHASGRSLLLCGAREQPAHLMKQTEFEQHVGKQNICENVETALNRASELYDDSSRRTAEATE